MQTSSQPTSHIAFYWRWFLSVVAMLMLAKIAVKFFALGVSGDPSGFLIAAYFLLIWVPLLIIAGTQQLRLLEYVQKHYGRAIDPIANTPKNVRLVRAVMRSDQGRNDQQLMAYESEIRALQKLIFVALFMFIPFCFFIVLW